MDKIISSLTLDDLLIQLAEEASEHTPVGCAKSWQSPTPRELPPAVPAQAAAKYYRVMRGANPSPVPVQDARDALVEEIADVNVAAEAVRRKMGISCDEIAEVEDAKIERWRRRVGNGI